MRMESSLCVRSADTSLEATKGESGARSGPAAALHASAPPRCNKRREQPGLAGAVRARQDI